MRYLLLLALVAASIPGCEPPPHPEAQPLTIDTKCRFQVKRVGIFEDNLAYGDRRGIYVIVDTQTETEYLGISGIGIAETGSHSEGKHHRPDER